MVNVETLLPHLNAVTIERVEVCASSVHVHVTVPVATVRCYRCGQSGTRVHSRYQRRLADQGIGGRTVEIRVRVRRFFCDNTFCPARTFVEQAVDLTERHARRTPPLRRFLETIAVALCGRAGARFAHRAGIQVSRNTLIRLIRELPDPAVGAVIALGVDDFALKRGHHYGTVLIDATTRQVIDLIAGRDAQTLAGWLSTHPGIQIICRDRAGSYADGARTDAPGAVQVADRFHLWQNLIHAVERCVAQHKNCLNEPVPVAAQPAPVDVSEQPIGRIGQRRREYHAVVHDLLSRGYSYHRIAAHLGWSRRTVARYANAATWQDMLTGPQRPRPSILDPYKAYLASQWTATHGAGIALYRQIVAQGYTGSYPVVRAFLATLPSSHRPPLPPPPPTMRQATGWLCRRPDNLTDDDTTRLAALTERCPHLYAAHQLVRRFAAMLTNRTGQKLIDWIIDAITAELPGISKFAEGLINDLAAVTAGLTTPWNSGPVEGAVNRIKMLKRQMYGRANLDLLRKRVLLAR